MDQKRYHSPQETLYITLEKGITKEKTPLVPQMLLAILAGAFIALAAAGSNMAAYGLWLNPETYGLGKLVAGAIFPIGLMLVLLAGAELFTGNNLLIIALADGQITLPRMLRNWGVVYLGNFVGSLLIVVLIILSGQLHAGGNLLGGATIKIAASKVSLAFLPAIALGILCNWLVCLAVWLAYAATDMAGKILAIFFPILLFITSGFEHSVANMYYVPAGILARENPAYAAASELPPEILARITWPNFLLHNLLPVTIGNIIGGTVFVGLVYWLAYRKPAKP
ncbi:MAG: FdhC protein [Bacteroidetes bacterium]|nr:MAG: FdhC protein [Bacteroidota bacterium]